MGTIVLVEKNQKVREKIIDNFKQVGYMPEFIFCESMKEAELIPHKEEMYFFVNKELQTYAKFSSPYAIIYELSDLKKVSEYVLYVYENMMSIDDVFSNISKYTGMFDRLVLSDTKDRILIPWEDIVSIERVKRYSLINTTEDKIYSTRQSFEELLPQLGEQFIQTHRSFIVNLSFVENCDKSQCLMRKGNPIPISRSCSKKVLEIWDRYKEIHQPNDSSMVQ